jgi:hypothetical protein
MRLTPPDDENVNDLLNQEHDQWIYRRMPLKLLFAAIRTTAKKRGILYFIPLCNISSKVVGKEDFHIIQNLELLGWGFRSISSPCFNLADILHHVLHYTKSFNNFLVLDGVVIKCYGFFRRRYQYKHKTSGKLYGYCNQEALFLPNETYSPHIIYRFVNKVKIYEIVLCQSTG